MLDSTAVRVHAHGCGAKGGHLAQAVARSRSSLSTKIHMAADALGYPLGFSLTGANVSDFDQVKPLIRKYLKPNSHAIMNKGYDSDAIRNCVQEQGGTTTIAVKANRTTKSAFDQHIYTHRHRIENLFARLKNYRRIATRYEKLLHTYAAMLMLASIIIWLKF